MIKDIDILIKDRQGDMISTADTNFSILLEIIEEAQRLTAELNCSYHSQEQIKNIFSKLTGKEVDDKFQLLPPFYTDFGKNIIVGKNVFINHACTFMDRGGITIGDNVLIAPKVNLITTNHPLDPHLRRATISKPIIIGDNVWIGTNATIMPNITIAENSIVAAGAVVTKDVPPNTIVAGVPAKIIKNL